MVQIITDYTYDLGGIIYYVPLNFRFSSGNNNPNQTPLDQQQIIPSQILSKIVDSKFVCTPDPRLTMRRIVIIDANKYFYTFTNPLQPYSQSFISLINEMKANNLIVSYRLWGETLTHSLLDLIISKNNG